jgi:thiosulfate dehydrogenase [quinone] large subunit
MDAVSRSWILGADWASQRYRQPGWLILPLRLFLAVTYLYASLQKLANPNYLRASSPTSFVAQTRALESSSPIGPLLRLSLHTPTFVALLVAVGELAVGTGVLVGLFTRVAAVGGALLSLTFFLTVSWSTTPYFYGSDIVFLFAWTVLIGMGTGGVLSVDEWIRARAARSPATLGAEERTVVARRSLLLRARAAGVLAVTAGVTAGLTAALGRVAGGTNGAGGSPALTPAAAGGTTPKRHARRRRQPAPTGTALAKTSQVPAGQAARFNDPGSGQPAWLVHSSQGSFVAFSAVCTHAGCIVGYDAGSEEFVCPCHGGRYSATSGRVLGGPPPSPLPQIPVHVVNNEIRVD